MPIKVARDLAVHQAQRKAAQFRLGKNHRHAEAKQHTRQQALHENPGEH